MDLVRDLDSRQGGRAMPLALPFLRYLASSAGDTTWAAAMDAWVTSTCQRLGVAPIPSPPGCTTPPVALQIQLAEATQEDTYWS